MDESSSMSPKSDRADCPPDTSLEFCIESRSGVQDLEIDQTQVVVALGQLQHRVCQNLACLTLT